MSESNIRTGTITAMTDQVRDPERINVALDGSFAFGLNRLVAAEHGLHLGQALTEPEVAALLAADEAARATEAGLRFLAYRPRSEREVRDRLRRRGFSEGALEIAIEKLSDWHYLDDAEFARFWVENRAEHQPRGRRLLKSELRAKGIDADIANSAIDEEGGDELPAALELAHKRAARLRGLEPQIQRRRLAGFLQRRGYGWDVIKPALDAALGDDDEDEGEEPE